MTERDQQTEGLAIRACEADDLDAMFAIINAAAEAYRGVIPTDQWHDPYMSAQALASEIAAGVVFVGAVADNRLVGVMGVQHRDNVDLIRHAYVLPGEQGRGIGATLIRHLCRDNRRPVLVGTWRAAEWAIRFYEGQGFARVPDDRVVGLLRTYWTVPDGQIAASVVLASPPLDAATTDALIRTARREASAPPPPAGAPATPSPPK